MCLSIGRNVGVIQAPSLTCCKVGMGMVWEAPFRKEASRTVHRIFFFLLRNI